MLVPRRSPATATRRRTAAQPTASIVSGRNVYVMRIQASGSAGKSAASTAKISSKARRLPIGPRDANRAARTSSREGIRRPQPTRVIATIVTSKTRFRPFTGLL